MLSMLSPVFFIVLTDAGVPLSPPQTDLKMQLFVANIFFRIVYNGFAGGR